MELSKTKLTVLALVSFALLVIGAFAYAKSQADDANARAYRLCVATNAGRKDSNLHVRLPLKASIAEQARLLQGAALMNARTPAIAAAYRRIAAKFAQYAAAVKPLPPLDCGGS